MKTAIKTIESFEITNVYTLLHLGDIIVNKCRRIMGINLCVVCVIRRELILKHGVLCIGLTPIAFSSEKLRTWYDDGLLSGWNFGHIEKILPDYKVRLTPVFSNESLPVFPEHPMIDNFCYLPMIDKETVIGFIVVANREGGFDEAFIDHVNPFVETCRNKILEYMNASSHIELELYTEVIDHIDDNISIAQHIGENNFRLVAYNKRCEEDSRPFGNINTKQNITELFSKPIADKAVALWTRAILHKETFTIVEGFLSASGETKYYSIHAFPHKLGGMMVTRDITDTVTQQIKAEDSNRMKNEFLSKISHELRTPLNSILGFAQLLMIKNRDASLTNYVESIIQSGDMLLNLINEILDLSKIESGKMYISLEPINIISCIMEVYTSMNIEAADNNVRMNISFGDLDNKKVIVLGDMQRYKQVFMNIISNAIKFNKVDGTIDIKCLTKGEYIHISIADTGIGIPASKIGLLYQPFERLGRHDIPGTGLGLSISKKLIDMMGASINVSTEEDEGAIFTIIIHIEDIIPIETFENKYKVLYIEDNIQNHVLIENILGLRDDILLFKALRGEIGLELIHEHRPDLIILDMNLPDMDGETVIQRLNPRTNNDYKIIVVSADAYTYRIQNALKKGVKDYITKPFDIKKFMTLLETHIPQRT
jgi:signal transduction histidine kinase/CheY-like chemotaxis protein